MDIKDTLEILSWSVPKTTRTSWTSWPSWYWSPCYDDIVLPLINFLLLCASHGVALRSVLPYCFYLLILPKQCGFITVVCLDSADISCLPLACITCIYSGLQSPALRRAFCCIWNLQITHNNCFYTYRYLHQIDDFYLCFYSLAVLQAPPFPQCSVLQLQ